MTTPELPARISLGWRRDRRLSFTGLKENRTLAHGEESEAIKSLLEDIYADATLCDGTNIAKPRLGNHFRVRWTTQGGSKLRFYLATVNKIRPKFEVPGDARTIKVRRLIEQAYEMARTDGQRAGDTSANPVAKTAAEIEEEDWTAKLLAGEIVEPTS